MFGFENLKQNSFEQLIINTVNEEIQNVFYRHSFDYEQKNYQREGLPFPPITYKDNIGALDLLLQVKKYFC
jgi:myosin heavy subunit